MTGVFETQTLRVCPTEPIICIKEKKQSLLFFPKFFATQKTFLNANIHRLRPNFEIGSLVGRNKWQ